MTSIFIKLLNLSISAGMLVLLVFVFRLFLKRYSKRAVCLLWIVVALRLIIPFSFESSFSIMPSGDFVKVDEATVDEALVNEIVAIDASDKISDVRTADNSVNSTESIYNGEKVEHAFDSGYSVERMENSSDSSHIGERIADASDSKYIPDNTENNATDVTERTEQSVLYVPVANTIANNRADEVPASDGTYTAVSNNAPEKLPQMVDDTVSNSKSLFTWLDSLSLHTWEILAYIWLLGAVLVFVYMVIAYARMRSLTAESIPFNDTALKNVYICDMIDSAFILGVVKPRIYLPGHLTGQQVENILAHEQVHLKRKDYIWKFIGFVLLMVYWFNPLMWLAYAFLCKDIEFACDEQVISDMNPAQIREYSDTLLVCSADRHFVYGCPLAFGEVAVKDRIKAALSYKKPLLWVIIVAFVLLVGAAVFFFAKPSENTDNDNIDDNGDSTVLTENPTGTEAEPEEYAEEYKGMDGHKYYKLKDGTYKSDMYEDYTYKYKFEVTGQIAGLDQKQVLLSNYDFDTFDKYWAENSSRDLRASFPPEDVLCVEKIWLEDSEDIEKKEAVRLAVENHTDINSTTALMNAISRKYKNKIVHDFDFTYVMPNGVNFGRNFGYSAGLYFKEYISTWTDFETIVQDESLTAPWKNDKQSENGYFVISTSDEYEDSNCGFKLYFKDGYVHLFEVDEKTETYLWSASLKDGFKPNLYSIRRIFFNKDMYDIYVRYCPYDIRITEPGIYNYNRGYILDLDGDGEDEKLFVANCQWMDYAEPENEDDFKHMLNYSNDPNYYDYYGDYPKSLIYINGELQNGEDNIDRIHDYFTYAFAVTDIDVNDGRYEILVNDDESDIFYVWKDGKLSAPKIIGANILRYDSHYVETTGWYDMKGIIVFVDFNGDGTFIGQGLVSLKEYGYSWGSDNILWKMDGDGNITRLNTIYDIPYSYDEEHLAKHSSKEYAEEWRNWIRENPGSYFWMLQLELDVAIEFDPASPHTYMPKGYVLVDKTDGKSKIHITYINSFDVDDVYKKSSYTGVSGWIDLADLQEYVRDYDVAGLKDANKREYMDILFSNINHAG
ncbi:MAG: hypothetical protein IKS98_15210 [Lachnospiraceae bacterium]|nr:hypothetical protein [Lachnospiraceae bacterium]